MYAFEPSEYTISRYLSKTAQANSNIQIIPLALSDRSGIVHFMPEHDGMGIGYSRIVDANADTAASVETMATSLDQWTHDSNIAHIDFIKADIEGAERYMLIGAKHVLREFAPKLAICKYHLPDDPQVLRQLILDANPNYVINERWSKLYAHVPH